MEIESGKKNPLAAAAPFRLQSIVLMRLLTVGAT